MDPSKFSVRVTNPTMVRQERFSNLPDLDITGKLPVYKSPNRYYNYATASASWCAPRKAQAIGSSASIVDDCSEKELRSKNAISNVRNHRRSSQQKRIEELSRPHRKISQSREIHSNFNRKLEKNSEVIISSPSDLKANLISGVPENQIYHRRPTDRIAKLAEPKVYEAIAVNPLGKVEERALFAVASKRITELAIPKGSSAIQCNPCEKRDPFGVNPRALRAACSSRIETLARPRKFTCPFSPATSLPKTTLGF